MKNIFDLGFGVIHSRKILKDTIEDTPELLALLLKGGNILHIPTIDWTTSLVNGSVTQEPARQLAFSSATANSSALAYANTSGFNEGARYDYLSWNKKLYIIFNYARFTDNAEAVARVQLKSVNSIGALGDLGIGIRLDNLVLVGESYGTVLGELDLATTLTVTFVYQIVIVLDPSVPKIEWYVNGVLKGTQSTATKIPSGAGVATIALVNSVANGATAAGAYSIIMHPKIWQAR